MSETRSPLDPLWSKDRSWLLDPPPPKDWVLGERDPGVLDEDADSVSSAKRRESPVEDVYELNYDREISFLVREGRIEPGLAPREIRS